MGSESRMYRWLNLFIWLIFILIKLFEGTKQMTVRWGKIEAIRWMIQHHKTKVLQSFIVLAALCARSLSCNTSRQQPSLFDLKHMLQLRDKYFSTPTVYCWSFVLIMFQYGPLTISENREHNFSSRWLSFEHFSG